MTYTVDLEAADYGGLVARTVLLQALAPFVPNLELDHPLLWDSLVANVQLYASEAVECGASTASEILQATVPRLVSSFKVPETLGGDPRDRIIEASEDFRSRPTDLFEGLCERIVSRTRELYEEYTTWRPTGNQSGGRGGG